MRVNPMALKNQPIFVLILLAAPLAHASYGQFKINIPLWATLLAIGLAILLLTPVWWSLCLIGKRISGGRLSARDGKLLRLWSGINFFYAIAYALGAINVIGISLDILLDPYFLRWVILPVLLLTALAIVGVRLGLNVAGQPMAANRERAGEGLSD